VKGYTAPSLAQFIRGDGGSKYTKLQCTTTTPEGLLPESPKSRRCIFGSNDYGHKHGQSIGCKEVENVRSQPAVRAKFSFNNYAFIDIFY
jgi:hypothetical protein